MLTKKFFKQIGVLFTLLLLMVCSIPRVYAVSETSDPYKIYDSEGKLLSVVNSLEEVEAYFESELDTPETYAIDCDGLGHRHGSRTYKETIRGDKYVEHEGNIYRVDILVTYCYYCHTELKREPVWPTFN